jgi:hypothetical protein
MDISATAWLVKTLAGKALAGMTSAGKATLMKGRVLAKSQPLFLAVETVVQPLVSAAGREDFQLKTDDAQMEPKAALKWC